MSYVYSNIFVITLYIDHLNTELSVCDVLHLGVEPKGKKKELIQPESDLWRAVFDHGAEPAGFIYLLCCVYNNFL